MDPQTIDATIADLKRKSKQAKIHAQWDEGARIDQAVKDLEELKGRMEAMKCQNTAEKST